MWRVLRTSPNENPDLFRSSLELVHSTTRYLILVTGGGYIAWHYVFTVCVPGRVSLPVWYVTPIVVGACGVALWLLSRHTVLAQAIWQLGLAAGISVGLAVFRQPEVAFLYALLPLLAVVTVGWQAGIAAEAVVIGLMTWLRLGGAGFVATPMMVMEVTAAGAFTGLLGWATSHALYTVTEWSLFSLARVRDAMEQAREHRAQLSRALKDLDQAYYRLKRANSALVVAWQAADEAERFKAEFVTSVSHELRTPLNLIVGFSEMMMMAPESYSPTSSCSALACRLIPWTGPLQRSRESHWYGSACHRAASTNARTVTMVLGP